MYRTEYNAAPIYNDQFGMVFSASLGRYCAIGASLVIATYLLIFAGDGLFAYFTPDDMMNLYDSWFRPLVETDRYLGTLVYRGLFAAFGLNPLPYRLVCLLLLAGNIALLYQFCLRVTNSREIGALACLLGAYHAHLADLYYSTGTIYDLLCAAFFLSAFLWITRPDVQFDRKRIGVFLLLYIAALNSKEMAITLPAIVLIYDVLYRRPLRVTDEARMMIPACLVSAAFLLFKIAGPRHMMENSAYRPVFTWATFVDNWQHYSFDLLYGRVSFTPLRVVLLWAILLAIIALLRRRESLFAFLFLFGVMLPVAFIPQRGFFAIYLTLPGWYLFAAAAIVAARDSFAAPRLALQAATFALMALILFPLHWRQKPLGNQWVAEAHATVRGVAGHLREVAGPLPRAAKVLFVSDPYPKDEWMLTFIFRLYYRDAEIRVDRARAMRVPPDAEAQASYDRLFITDGRTLTALPHP
jgi:hypothetical protein